MEEVTEIPQEIRSKISQLDDLSREIAEWFTDNEDFIIKESIETFRMLLEELETGITNFQESQKWI